MTHAHTSANYPTYQISEAHGPLTEAERVAKQQRREQRRANANEYLDARTAGRPGRTQTPTLTGEELVEVERLAHERIRANEASHRRQLRKKCSSITDLLAVVSAPALAAAPADEHPPA